MKNKKLIKIFIGAFCLFVFTNNTLALSKDETVYAKINSKGEVKKTVVTEHLINDENSKEIKDITDLKNIKNINGDEKFTKNNNELIWNANKNDIYYQGQSNKTLPISTKITYKLDGKIYDNPKDMTGKKGDVEININFYNNEKHLIKAETLYTPFVVLVETNIPTKNNKNIIVNNGKVISTGKTNVVGALASPGLYESLKLNELKDLNNVTIKYKTKKFKMNSIYITATSKILEDSDADIFNKFNSLYSNVDKLNDASNKLVNGSKELLEGINTIGSKLPNEHENKKNEDTLKNLKSTNISTVSKLTSANSSLKIQESEIDQKIEEASQNKAYIENKISDVDTKLNAATDAYNNYLEKLNQVNAGINSLEQAEETGNDEQKQTLAILKGKKESLEQIIPLLLNQKEAIEGTKQALEGTVSAIDGTYTLLNSTKSSIETSINANTNLATLISGNNRVVDSSINTIYSMRTLSDAMKQLESGATTLKDGMTQFNNKGISKISNMALFMKNKQVTIKNLIDLSNNYKSFSKVNYKIPSNTKFIIVMDEK